MEFQKPQLGFGTLRLPGENGKLNITKIKKMVDEYQKGSFCYYDVHPHYLGGKAEEMIRKTVVERYPRESFLLADKMPFDCKSQEHYENYFEASLTNCGVDFFDYYLLHCMTDKIYKNHEKLGGFDFLLQKKSEGYIKHIGFSFHDKPELLDKILTAHPETEFVYLQINYFDWNNPLISAEENYKIALKHNVPVFVMEPIKGGNLIMPQKYQYFEKFDLNGISIPSLALNFVSNLDGVHIIMSGMTKKEHIVENRKTIAESRRFPIPSNIFFILNDELRKENKISCTACHYCERECPSNIPIPDIFSLLNSCDREIWGTSLKNFPGGRYNVFSEEYKTCTANKGRAGDCIKCGRCELKCPQKINIRSYISIAHNTFEKTSVDIKVEGIWKRFETICGLMRVSQKGLILDRWFTKKNYKNIAIYGLGEIGRLFFSELQKYPNISVRFGIDKNARNIHIDELNVVEPSLAIEDIDAVIVTATFAFDLIRSELENKTNSPIVSLDEIIEFFEKCN